MLKIHHRKDKDKVQKKTLIIKLTTRISILSFCKTSMKLIKRKSRWRKRKRKSNNKKYLKLRKS